ncbi:hypothetical protein [Sphingobacterium thalpophilum]|uniref:hypothetical protein n=1 Tax=Sphingobacterium thalpophilum TaxID=259 RepID=UPI0024A6DD1F|nr:hypothetical protein [Sphingobacterium thalpophilum]
MPDNPKSRSIFTDWIHSIRRLHMFKLIYCAAVLILTLVRTCADTPAQQSATIENKPRPAWLKPVYHEAVMIEDSDCTEKDGTYLIDRAVDFHPDSMAVFFVAARLPRELFENAEGFYPELREFILVMPDYEAYEQVAKDAEKQGITLEPAVSNYYYYVKREDGKATVDRYHLTGEGQPQLHYAVPKIPKDKILVYRTESYGSVCCPKDGRRVLEAADASFIRQYEQQHGVQIKGSFRQINGKEGEHNNYYTLSGLNRRQRLDFLLAKNRQWQFEGKTLLPTSGKQIITPALVQIETEGIRKLEPIAYR